MSLSRRPVSGDYNTETSTVVSLGPPLARRYLTLSYDDASASARSFDVYGAGAGGGGDAELLKVK